MKKHLLGALCLVWAVTSYAQTNYEEIPLEGTPINVTDRKEDPADVSPSFNGDLQVASAASAGTGGSAISETMGDLSVSPTGGAAYSVPIKVPPGINGVVPTIAITYNSQGRNGLAGYGWNVSGVSVISRIPSTRFHDNNIDPVDYDSSDRFALDGQRLVVKSGTYGSAGSVYETENFSNLKITAVGTTSYGPEYFIVNHPDGSVAHYGATAASRSRNDYAILFWQNPQGVRVEYAYTLMDNSLSISAIGYGHRIGSTATNFINFVYKTRRRAEQSYMGGVDFKRKNILSEIKVKSGTVGYRNYTLAHSSNTLGYERLLSVTEKSGDNTQSFSPISFSYSDTPTTLGSTAITTTLNVSNIEQRNAVMVPLEVDGDGKMDFIVYPKTRSERTKLWLFKDIKSGANNIGRTIEPLAIYESVFPMSYLNAVNGLSDSQGFGLITQSGTSNIAFKVNGKSGTGYSQVYEKIWLAPSYSTAPTCGFTPTTYRVPMNYLSGDFNGDGLTDAIAISKAYSYSICREEQPPCSGGQPVLNGTNVQQGTSDSIPKSTNIVIPGGCCECTNYTYSNSTVYFVNLDRRIGTGFTNTAGNLSVSLKSTDRLFTADVNGDGKTDILHVTAGRVYAYTLSATNGLVALWNTSSTYIKDAYPIFLGDYNGDGKTDFMTPSANNSTTFTTFLSTGIQFTPKTQVHPFTYRQYSIGTSPINSYDLIPTDVNGDGRTDMLEYKTTTNNGGANGSQTVSMYNNTFSTATDVAPTFSYVTAKTQTGTLNHLPIPVFLSSNDRPNSNLDFATISNNRVFTFSFGKDNRDDMLLRSVSNNGVGHSITYRDMVDTEKGLDNIPVYYPLTNQVYPYVDIKVARGTKLVAGITRTVSGTTSIRQVFSYQGAVAHADGLGFLGFSGLARSEWNTGNTDRIWNITKHDISRRGAVTSAYSIPYTVNFATVPSDYITKTSFVNASSLASNKMFKVNNTSNVVQNRLEGTAITTSYFYDTYNNPLKITTDYSGQGSSVVDLTYGNSTSSTYYIGRPLTKKSTVTISGNPFSSEEQYTYTGYLMTTRKTKGNGTQLDSEVYSHDVFGNVKSKTTTPYGATARQVKFDYDTSGRYLIKSYDVENLATTFEYNTTIGTLKKEINPYGLATNYLYDSWNRLTKVTDYLGKNASTGYAESSYSYTVTVTADDGGSKITVYDPLKRMVKESSKDVLGQLVSKSYQYDKFDRIWKESEPYIGSAATQWNTTEYDLYGRPKSLTVYTNKITNISYSGQSVTVNDGTKTVSTTKNALGNITKVTDPGGTIDYTYYGNGAMKTSTYGGITISTEQDGWGRKTKLTDPSAGVYIYAYNGFGEMTKETTPKGATDYIYSPLGKLTQKKVTGDASTNMVINYAYDATSKLPTSITLATNGDGNTGTTTFTYDSYKRLTSSVESNTYATFTKNLTYDSFGRVYSEESIARLLSNGKSLTTKTKNAYVNGQLKNITGFSSNEELYNVTGLNARGQVTTSTVGTGMKRTNTYDTFGYLTQALAQKNVTTSPVEVMKLTYAFNAQRGTLTSRSNSLFAWNETFTYDNQNRLLAFNDTGGTKSHTYDSKGRIDVNSQLGQYKYNGANFQQIELALNASGEAYFNNYTTENITYNAFKSPVEINENGKDRINFQYNAGMGRSAMFYGDTNSDKLLRRYRRHYSQDGSMEITWDKTTGKTVFTTYIGGDAYSASAVYHSEQTSTTTSQYYYLHRDYLGSILAITDKSGTLKEKRHFDAWGNIAKWTNGSGTAITKGMIGGGVLDRGYTGHEHLFGVNLVHMNGRLYDPFLHRFLMPDNFVQDPYSTISYNRYGYAWNNPLMYTDPSGEIIPLIIIGAAVIGAYIGGAQANGTYNPFKWNWSSGDTWKGIVGGAVVGAAASVVGIAASIAIAPTLAGLGISGGIIGGAITGIVSGAASGAVSGGFMTQLPGGSGDFWGGFTKGAWQGAWMGGLTGAALGGLFTPKGHNIWTGAAPRPSLSQVSTMDTQGVSLTDDTMSIKAELLSPENSVTPKTGPTTQASTSGGAIQDGMGGNLNIPATRDPFDLVKVATHSEGIATGTAAVHGNSLSSTRPTWGYKLYSQDGTFLKNGITSKPIPETRYSRAFMIDKKMVPYQQFPNRLGAWQWEYQQNLIKRGPLNLNMH